MWRVVVALPDTGTLAGPGLSGGPGAALGWAVPPELPASPGQATRGPSPTLGTRGQAGRELGMKYETLHRVGVHTRTSTFCVRLELACVTKRKQSVIHIFNLWTWSSDLASQSGKAVGWPSNIKSSLIWKLKNCSSGLICLNVTPYLLQCLYLDNPVSSPSDRVTGVDTSGKILALPGEESSHLR